MKLIVHIGMEKTGSTAIQLMLDANRDLLRDEGIGLIRSAGSPNNRMFAQYCQPDDTIDSTLRSMGIRSPEEKRALMKHFEDALTAEIMELGPEIRQVAISSEHLQSRLIDIESIGRLKSLLARFGPVEIIVYLRDQAQVLRSLYSTALKVGHDESLSDFARRMERDCAYFDYDALLNRWAAVFGKDALRVAIFRRDALEGGDVRCDFLTRVLGRPPGTDVVFPDNGGNKSLGPTGVVILRAINRRFPKFRDGRYIDRSHRVGNFLRRLTLRGLQPLLLWRANRISLPDPETIRARYRDSNRAVSRRFFNQDNAFY